MKKKKAVTGFWITPLSGASPPLFDEKHDPGKSHEVFGSFKKQFAKMNKKGNRR